MRLKNIDVGKLPKNWAAVTYIDFVRIVRRREDFASVFLGVPTDKVQKNSSLLVIANACFGFLNSLPELPDTPAFDFLDSTIGHKLELETVLYYAANNPDFDLIEGAIVEVFEKKDASQMPALEVLSKSKTYFEAYRQAEEQHASTLKKIPLSDLEIMAGIEELKQNVPFQHYAILQGLSNDQPLKHRVIKKQKVTEYYTWSYFQNQNQAFAKKINDIAKNKKQ